jgi:hypothetical protein
MLRAKLITSAAACCCVQCRDHALSEHKTLKDILSDIDAMTVNSPGFKDKLEILMHVSDVRCCVVALQLVSTYLALK